MLGVDRAVVAERLRIAADCGRRANRLPGDVLACLRATAGTRLSLARIAHLSQQEVPQPRPRHMGGAGRKRRTQHACTARPKTVQQPSVARASNGSRSAAYVVLSRHAPGHMVAVP